MIVEWDSEKVARQGQGMEVDDQLGSEGYIEPSYIEPYEYVDLEPMEID
jgi:hypothetical protein